MSMQPLGTTRRVPGYTPPGYRAPEDPDPRVPRRDPGRDAMAIIRDAFEQYLGGQLMEFVEQGWLRYNQGITVGQIIREMRDSAPYHARFTGMKALRAKGRTISEREYIDIESRMASVAREFGLPQGFYDGPEDFGKFIGGEVSPAEFQRRLTAWQTYERQNRDPDFEAEVRRQFAAAGMQVNDGYFLAGALDPERAVAAIERNLASAAVGTEARRSGYGEITLEQTQRLADLGVDQQAASRGFGALAESRELFGGLAGEVDAEEFGADQQIGAAFGTDLAAQRRIERQRRRRQAAFEGGGGTNAGRGGLSALGSAG